MKLTKQATQENSLTEFDKKMIQAIKKIPELKSWNNEQFVEYCSILKCYSMLIVTSVLNEKNNSAEPKSLTVSSSQLKQAA